MKKLWTIVFVFMFLAACGDPTELPEENGREEAAHSLVFRQLDVQVENGSFTLTGEVNAEEGLFYYKIERGKDVLLEETTYELETKGEWESFEITGEIEDPGESDPPILILYGKSSDGDVYYPNYVPIDIEEK